MKEELKKDLGGGNSSNQIPSNSQELVLTIPEELRGKELNIVYEASWISNLKVNDSNNTVTGTVSANTGSARSTTITLTASGYLSTTSPSSFVVSQSAGQQAIIIWFGATLKSGKPEYIGPIVLINCDKAPSTDVTVKGTYYSSSSQYYDYTAVVRRGETSAIVYAERVTETTMGGATISSLSPNNYGNEKYYF